MAYKGSIPKGSRVDIELQVDAGAKGAALVAVSFADNGGGSGSDSATVAPAGTGRCGVQTDPGSAGLLRVFVDLNDDTDTGMLTVSVGGAVYDHARITGDTTWSYSLS